MIISGLSGVLLAFMAVPFVALVGLTAKGGADSFLELPANLTVPPLPQASRILDSQGNVIGYLRGEQDREIVTIDQVPMVMRQAIIDIEDSRFYEHTGLDYKGLIRAYVTNQESGSVTQGGSTLTQQYVKNVLLQAATTRETKDAATEQTVKRKLREARYALYLEDHLSKDQILERYLNIAYFGDGAYGVQTAAKHYFNVDVSRLTLPQAAMLAGLVKNPTAYNPVLHPQAATIRRDIVLERMRELGHINDSQLRETKAVPLTLNRPPQAADPCQLSSVPFFCAYVRRVLLADERFGATQADRERLLFEGGLTIRTTLSPIAQAAAQNAASGVVPPGNRAAAGVAMIQPGTGKVLALAVNRVYGPSSDGLPPERTTDFTHTKQIIPLEETSFSPGSTFKVFTLAAAIEKGMPLGTTYYSPVCYHSNIFNNPRAEGSTRASTADCFGNADPSEAGLYSMTTATWHSVNTYYIQLAEKVGVQSTAEMARRLGVTSCRVQDHTAALRQRCPPGGIGARDGSAVLGSNEISTMDLATAYATLANHGIRCDPQPFESITQRVGGTDRPVAYAAPQPCRQVLGANVADSVTSVLEGVILHGTGAKNAQIGRPAAGKTGTAQGFSTASFAGYIPQLAVAVTLADPRSPTTYPLRNVLGLNQVYGGDLPAAVWARTMRGAIDGLKLPVAAMPAPDDSEPNPPKETLPDVVGQNVVLARALLTAQGFGVTVQEVNNPAPAGTVLAMNPAGGQDVPAGSDVVLMVSQGPDSQPRPDGGGTPAEQPATVPPRQPVTATASPAHRRGNSILDIFGGD
ncbi:MULTISPECIES: transglycosylase domain-containing protein [unclassified Frankia]|uniref:transglycosylase domain-containing protein n=1 Tax=unclassified Frankia TaxID=2632575 RepID=UPI001EF71D04|nr:MULTISPECIES: transglycosylase domain-containing protein [unclassified Frankia]